MRHTYDLKANLFVEIFFECLAYVKAVFNQYDLDFMCANNNPSQPVDYILSISVEYVKTFFGNCVMI